jgi:general secretion pathway protein C
MLHLGAPSELTLAGATAWIEELKSVDGLTRLLAERGGQVLAVLLLLALALDSAVILTRVLDGGSAEPPSAPLPQVPTQPSSAVNPALQLATIVNAHLFGRPGVSQSADAPATTMPLILAGVIADKDPSKGQAIIGPNAAGAKLYAVGAAISGGARLHAVYDDKVLLERNGALEALMLPRTLLTGAASAAVPQATRVATAIRDNSSLLAGLVRVQPVFVQNKLTGYRIFPGGARGNAAFTQLGLMPGDLIQAVNGTALDDVGRAMDILQTLGSAGNASVTVLRNGQSQEVNLNLATLNIDAEAGDNTAQAGSPDQSANGGVPPAVVPPGGPGFRSRMGGLPNLGAAPGAAAVAPGTMNTAPAEADVPGGGGNERDR